MNKKELPPIHNLVLSVLPKGHESSIPFKEVMQRIGFRDKDSRQIRSVLSELPMVYKEPVGSTSTGKTKGFFILETQEDYEKAIHTLRSRELHIQRRKNGLTEAWLKNNKAN